MKRKINFKVKQCYKNGDEKQKRKAFVDILNTVLKKGLVKKGDTIL